MKRGEMRGRGKWGREGIEERGEEKREREGIH
jgi:hypothetical protein